MNTEKDFYYIIADFFISIKQVNTLIDVETLLPSFKGFSAGQDGGSDSDNLFRLSVDDKLGVVPQSSRKRIRIFDTGNGLTTVDSITSGGYQFIIHDIYKRECCLLVANADFSELKCALNGDYFMRSFGLNNALMLSFAFAASSHGAVLLHASVVRQNGWAYAFTAPSGTGKSTQTGLWVRFLDGCDLINDDSPVVRVIDDDVYIYGGPWSGKTPCYRRVRSRLAAITKISRAKENSVDKMSVVEAFATFVSATSSMRWDNGIFDNICDTAEKIIKRISFYVLHCLPDKESAEICNRMIRKS